MSYLSRFFVAGFVLILALVAYKYHELTKPLPIPQIDVAAYWGPGEKAKYKEDPSIVPFKVSYPDKVIDDLKQQLSRPIAFVKPLEGVAFRYGFNSDRLKDIIKYWNNSYLPKWRKREEFLSKFPHFTTQIQGLRMHFIHQKVDASVAKKKKNVFPLLLVHGWPGSVREFYELIPLLSNGQNSEYAFEVVAPSLPGYGWSEGSSKTGMGAIEVAIILRNLMIRLGYKKFFYQGGDWGSIIGSHLATLFPDNVIGYHANLCMSSGPAMYSKKLISSFAPKYFVPEKYIDFHYPLSNQFSDLIEETGYFHLQATKPDTIGIALTTNPIGLAAYILEKFSSCSGRSCRDQLDGCLGKVFSFDALLDNVMIYYLTNSITTAVRLYAESVSIKQFSMKIDRVQTNVTMGCARFKNDLPSAIDWELRSKFTKLVHSTYHTEGGHFIALERPDALYKDFTTFVKKAVID